MILGINVDGILPPSAQCRSDSSATVETASGERDIYALRYAQKEEAGIGFLVLESTLSVSSLHSPGSLAALRQSRKSTAAFSFSFP